MRDNESVLGRSYRLVYESICGRHPHLRPWHFQWLDAFYLYRALRRRLLGVHGKILDVGCGEKPYRTWLGEAEEYIGLDVLPGAQVDVVVTSNEKWPFEDQRFDAVIATQTIEHVEEIDNTLSEMARVVKPGGLVILSFPFLYHEHGAPYDFRRLTIHSASKLFPDMQIVYVERQGGIGSTLSILLTHWIEYSLNLTTVTRFLKAALLPVWIPTALVINLIGLLLDRVDRTNSFYSNIYIEFRKSI